MFCVYSRLINAALSALRKHAHSIGLTPFLHTIYTAEQIYETFMLRLCFPIDIITLTAIGPHATHGCWSH